MDLMKGFIKAGEREETMKEAVNILGKVDLLLEDHMRVDQEDQLEEMVEDHKQAHCCQLSVTHQRWRMPCLDMRRMACLDTESK